MWNKKIEMKVDLNDVKNVEELVGVSQLIKEKTILKSDKTSVDAKSIVGVFSLDLTSPLTYMVELEDNSDIGYINDVIGDIKHIEV